MDVIESIKNKKDGQSLEVAPDLFMFRIPKFRYRHGQSYGLVVNKDLLLIDAVHEITKPAIDALRHTYRIAGILLTHSDLIKQAFGSMEEVRNWAGADIYAHEADHMDEDLKDLSYLEKEPLKGYDISYRHIPGHTPGSCIFYEPGYGRLFTGDAAVGSSYDSDSDTFSHPPIREEDWDEYKAAWDRVNFNVIEVYPLHGKPKMDKVKLEELKASVQNPDNTMK